MQQAIRDKRSYCLVDEMKEFAKADQFAKAASGL